VRDPQWKVIKNDLKGRSGETFKRDATQLNGKRPRRTPAPAARQGDTQPCRRTQAARSYGLHSRHRSAKAESEIAQAERLSLSERDSLRVLKLLENPPAPTARLLRAAKVGFRLP
jgi:hypothetical protein